MRSVRLSAAVAVVLVMLTSGTSSFANEGFVLLGGAPCKLSSRSHHAITMQEEFIKIRASDSTLRAACEFVFKNSGHSCDVTMGFPDIDEDPPNDTTAYDSKGKFIVKSAFDTFKSYVDGKLAPLASVAVREKGRRMSSGNVRALSGNCVVNSCRLKPQVRKNRFYFGQNNWVPKQADDIDLAFAYHDSERGL